MSGEAYSWTVLRFVPRVERGERINVGAAVFSRRQRFLGFAYELDEARLRALDPTVDLELLGRQLSGLQRVAEGEPTAGRVAGMELSDRFGFIAAPSSTVLQPSPVHVGLSDDPQRALDDLMARAVLL